MPTYDRIFLKNRWSIFFKMRKSICKILQICKNLLSWKTQLVQSMSRISTKHSDVTPLSINQSEPSVRLVLSSTLDSCFLLLTFRIIFPCHVNWIDQHKWLMIKCFFWKVEKFCKLKRSKVCKIGLICTCKKCKCSEDLHFPRFTFAVTPAYHFDRKANPVRYMHQSRVEVAKSGDLLIIRQMRHEDSLG